MESNYVRTYVTLDGVIIGNPSHSTVDAGSQKVVGEFIMPVERGDNLELDGGELVVWRQTESSIVPLLRVVDVHVRVLNLEAENGVWRCTYEGTSAKLPVAIYRETYDEEPPGVLARVIGFGLGVATAISDRVRGRI